MNFFGPRCDGPDLGMSIRLNRARRSKAQAEVSPQCSPTTLTSWQVATATFQKHQKHIETPQSADLWGPSFCRVESGKHHTFQAMHSGDHNSVAHHCSPSCPSSEMGQKANRGGCMVTSLPNFPNKIQRFSSEISSMGAMGCQ